MLNIFLNTFLTSKLFFIFLTLTNLQKKKYIFSDVGINELLIFKFMIGTLYSNKKINLAKKIHQIK